MDRRSYKSKPQHLVTDPRTGEIKKIIHPSDTDVGNSTIPANLRVFGDSQTKNAIITDDLVVTGSSKFLAGLSGSLTRLSDNTSFLRSSDVNITIVSSSNGAIVVSNRAKFLHLTSTLTNTTTIGQNSGLRVATDVNEDWNFEVCGNFGCNNTGGVKVEIGAPSGSVVQGFALGALGNASTLGSTLISSPNVGFGAFSTVTGPSPRMFMLSVNVRVGSTAGDIEFRYSSVVTGQTSTLYSGSHMRAQRSIGV